MKTALILLFAIVSLQASAQQFYRELLLKAEHASTYSDYFGQACFNDLSNFYKKGKLLKSPIIVANSKPISELGKRESPLEDTRKTITKTPAGYYTFYHYTKAPSLLTAFDTDETNRDKVHEKSKTGAYAEMMSFLKVPKSAGDSLFQTKYIRFSRGVVYVSTCPLCSTTFGHIQLSFTLSPDARWVSLEDADPKWPAIANEASALYPEIFRSCTIDKIGGLLIEDSGIDLVDYTNGMWFQLTNFYRVVNSDGIIAAGSHDEVTSARVSSRVYSMNKSWGNAGSVASPPAARGALPRVTPQPEPKKDPSIEIVEASWGVKNNILKNTKSFCDSKLTCDYKIHEKYLPGITYDASKPQAFTVKWKCDGVTVKTHTIPGDAHDKIASIKCD